MEKIKINSEKRTTINIVGPKNMHNELISQFLGNALGATCNINGDVERLMEMPEAEKEKKLILFDIRHKDMHRLFIELNGKIKVIKPFILMALYNMEYNTGSEKEALHRGIKGFFYINDTKDLFLKGVTSILKGQLWVSRELLSECVLEDIDGYQAIGPRIHKNGNNLLSRRETEIITMVSVGARNEEIADKLCISPHTVKTHLYNIYKKIKVGDRLQAVLWAAKHL
jgi:LuxR family transcriptional regulator of csgAB operon